MTSWGDENFTKPEMKTNNDWSETTNSSHDNESGNNDHGWGSTSSSNNDHGWGSTPSGNNDQGWGSTPSGNNDSRGRGGRGRGRGGRGRGGDRGRGRGGDRGSNTRGKGGDFNKEDNNLDDNVEVPENAVEDLFIRGINYEATEDDLKDTFNKYGTISSCKILKDKETQKSKGCGFVKFADKKSAVRALNDADNLVCKGRNLLVRFANDKEGEFKGKKKGASGFNNDNDENKRNDGDGERGRGRGRGRGGDRGRGRGGRGGRGRGRDQDNHGGNSNGENNSDNGWSSMNNRERSRSNDKDKDNEW